MKRAENNILLISITLCWAASYIFIKNLPAGFSDYAYLTMTTGIAAILMMTMFFKKLFTLKKSTLKKGFYLSLLLSLNLIVERKGIALIQPEMASFLSALTILMVPLLLLLLRKKPGTNNLVGAGIILLGLLIGINFQLKGLWNAGTLYMLAGCACSAVYTIAVDRYAKEEEPVLICMVQMAFTALTGFVLWMGEEPSTFLSIHYTRELLSNIFVLAFFTKAYAYIVLMFAQKYTDAVSVTVIASTEPIITLLLGVLLPAAYGGARQVDASGLLGAMVIAAGAIVAGLHFLEKKRDKDDGQKDAQMAMPLEAADTHEKKAVTGREKLVRFMIVLVSFLVLGIAFKVMVLVEGLTEIRPVNALPPVAGLVCGPIGAVACGIGNLLADMVGTLSPASALGVAANFLAAYLPYRLWYLFSKESPNLHGGKKMLLYGILSYAGALTSAWILSFGLWAINGVWMEEIYTYVFFNNFGFSIGLGMPLLILLTSLDMRVQCHRPPKSLVKEPLRYLQKTAFATYLTVMTAILLTVQILHGNPGQTFWMQPLSAAALLGLICLLL